MDGLARHGFIWKRMGTKFRKISGLEKIHYEIFVPTIFKGPSHPGRWSAYNRGDDPFE